MIQREILYRNEYYQDMERYQEQIQDIRLAEEIIYSANPVVNAILKVKSVKAKEKEIPMQVTTLLPQREMCIRDRSRDDKK